MDGLGLKRGILINFVAKYSNIFMQLIISSILARLLTPEEYGIISVIMIFILFFYMLGDVGVGPAIIQYKDLDKDDISSIFIFTIFIAISLGLIFFVFSYFIAYFYGNSIYVTIGHLLCFSVIFNALCIVPNALQLKNKQFKIVGASHLISNVVSGIITIILAFRGFSYYALVFNSIMQAALRFFILLYFTNIKINLKKFSFKPIKRIGRFSIYQFLFNFVNYFSRNSDNLLIGKFIGISALGFYDKAYKLMLYPIQNLTFVITPVLQPVLSDYQDRKDIILKHYMKIVKILALLGAFISVFCFFSAKEIILIVFGSRWSGSIASFKYLSMSIVIQMVLSSSGSIFQATGNTKYMFVNGLINAFTMVSLIIIGLVLGKIEYVAALLVVGFMINFLRCYYVLINKVFKQKFFEFLKEFKSTIITMLLMIGFYSIFRIDITNCFISILLKFVIGITAYALGLFITKEYIFFRNIFFKDRF